MRTLKMLVAGPAALSVSVCLEVVVDHPGDHEIMWKYFIARNINEYC